MAGQRRFKTKSHKLPKHDPRREPRTLSHRRSIPPNLESIKDSRQLTAKMTNSINTYAATAPGTPLQAFSYDPGELGPEEVEIKVTHCGICHSDLSMLDNEWGLSKYPFVPGHEAVGTIVALGDAAN
jgi:hypothetical protein